MATGNEDKADQPRLEDVRRELGVSVPYRLISADIRKIQSEQYKGLGAFALVVHLWGIQEPFLLTIEEHQLPLSVDTLRAALPPSPQTQVLRALERIEKLLED